MAVENVVSFGEAAALVAQVAASCTKVSDTEEVSLLGAPGRVLAAPVVADRDQPAFDRATRDGFAVRAAELPGGLEVVGEVKAGSAWVGNVPCGATAAIMTGAPLPAGADAVVMVEHVVRAGGRIQLLPGRALAAAENVVARGSEAQRGAVVVAPGTRVGAAEVALAAACGYPELRVAAKPRVAIVATGDELVEVAETPGTEQIRNSNSYAIAAMVAAAGGEPVRLAVAPDTREAVRARVAEGRQADLLVFSGGVSMGEYDLVEDALGEAGAEFLFTGVKMQPGKPVVFGRLPARDGQQGCLFFGLPGNPVSTQVTFQCFAAPLLRALGGEAGPLEPLWTLATLAEEVAAKPGITRLLPCRVAGTSVELVGWQGSGDLAANARANGYVELLPGRSYAAGELVRVLLR